jgi:hypothetical protein
MITLASSTGSSSYEIGDLAFPPDEEERIFFNAVQLLEAQGERRAAQILRSFGFHIHQGINDFADEFMVLHAELPLPQYVDIKKRMESDWTSEFVGDVKRIQETLSDLDLYVRFVSCALKREEPPPTWREEDASSSDMGSRKNYALDPRPIGRGGYAEVFRARHKKSGVVVAFKRALDNDEDSAARLRREIEEQSKLVHPHVMPILDHSKTFGWFTMPCAMGDLEKLRPELDDAMLVEMLDQAAQGLAAAHALGLVHRDVTPRNILALAENDGIRRIGVSFAALEE